MIMISKFFFNFRNFCVIICFLTKLLALGILFSTAVNAVFVANILTSGILSSISVILVLQTTFLTWSLVLRIFFSISDLFVSNLVFETILLVLILFTFATYSSYTVFLTTSFFTTSLNLFKLQFLDKLNFFLVQNLKYQHEFHF